MTENGFDVGIEFSSVLEAISKQIYDTPLAFLRENVQNAVDAIRMQAQRDGVPSSDERLRVDVTIDGRTCEIRDNGIGMSLGDLRNLFWTIGASGKRTEEARAAGCVGMFGIGGFANLGVCESLTVASQAGSDEVGHWTRLSRQEIEQSGGAIPKVSHGETDEVAPRGTLVRGELQEDPDVQTLRDYIAEFVRYAEEHVHFNGELLSRQPFRIPASDETNLVPIPDDQPSWTHGSTTVHGQLLETAAHTLHASLQELDIGGDVVRLRGWVRFENGPVEVLKRGFKICTTSIPTQIGISGAIDCDRLAPTAGRDSLDAESTSLITIIGAALERAAVGAVLESSERIAQHTRIFRYVRTQGLVEHIGWTAVELADGSELTLREVRRRSEQEMRVYFATSKNRDLSQLLQARGHIVVQLPADHDKQVAIREYLATYCSAESFEGKIECTEVYANLNLFERAFLSELERTVTTGYEVSAARIIPGRLTEDVPVYAPEAPDGDLTIYVDVRHPEVAKLEALGISPLLWSMIAAFCREYLGPTLRSRSPKFFGSGAVNLDWLAKRRSELWVLLTDDIHVVSQGSQRQVVRQSDVQVVNAGGPAAVVEQEPSKEPKLIRIEGSTEFAQLFGHYLRIPSSATIAYGDVIQQCESRAAVWAGNKIVLVASDSISTAFQFEIRLDRLVVVGGGDRPIAGGAAEIDRPLQGLFGGLYFPVPEPLETFLVPTGDQEIRIEVRCDWIDFLSARTWEAKASA